VGTCCASVFDDVLVGVDGASGGRDAIALARGLAGPGGSLTLVHVRAEPAGWLYPAAPGLEGEREASERILDEARAEAGVEAATVSLAAASPGRGLHVQAEAQDADLIVVGSSRRGVLGRATLGDDTRAALNGAPCAVAVAARGFAPIEQRTAVIGVAYDESPESEHALAVARELATRRDARVRVLEVVSYPASFYVGTAPVIYVEAISDAVNAARERLAKLEGVEPEVAQGVPGEELARFGDEVDLLVCGSRGYGPIRRLILGSTSNYLARHARCSLLVIPREAD
jgi:nucleotide-binding universal stress UspA family protein